MQIDVIITRDKNWKLRIFFSSFSFKYHNYSNVYLCLFIDILSERKIKYLEYFPRKITMGVCTVNRAWISIVHDERKKCARSRRFDVFKRALYSSPYTRGTRLYECLPITGSLDTDCRRGSKFPPPTTLTATGN